MNEETAREGIRVREAEKAHNIRTFSHGRGVKKKNPNCIQIRVLLWVRTLIWIQLQPGSSPVFCNRLHHPEGVAGGCIIRAGGCIDLSIRKGTHHGW